MWEHECRCLQIPDESVGRYGAGVAGVCELSEWLLGTKLRSFGKAGFAV